jgi:hypothetical protein
MSFPAWDDVKKTLHYTGLILKWAAQPNDIRRSRRAHAKMSLLRM